MELVVVVFLKKDKAEKYMNSYRPISLLNCDYTLFTNISANYLTVAVPSVIHNDKNGFLIERNMATNTHYLTQPIDNFSAQKIKAAFIMLDIEKAFGQVQWNVLLSVS